MVVSPLTRKMCFVKLTSSKQDLIILAICCFLDLFILIPFVLETLSPFLLRISTYRLFTDTVKPACYLIRLGNSHALYRTTIFSGWQNRSAWYFRYNHNLSANACLGSFSPGLRASAWFLINIPCEPSCQVLTICLGETHATKRKTRSTWSQKVR